MRFKQKTSGTTYEPIPRKLHQTWKSNAIPPAWIAHQTSWQTLHTHWSYRLWTDEDNRQLIAEHYPWFLPTYDQFPRDIQRVDAAKYFILYHHGGLYVDLDSQALRTIDDLLTDGGVVVSRTPDGVIDGAFLASPPKHPFWEQTFSLMQRPTLLARLLTKLPWMSASAVLFTTGPQMLRVAVRRYRRSAQAGITVLPPERVSSRSWLRRFQPFPAAESYVHHHHTDSWLRPGEKLVHGHFNIVTLRLIWAGLAGAALGTVWLLFG